MTTNAWSRRGLAGLNSTNHTTTFRPGAATFTPASQMIVDGVEGEYYPLVVAPFVPPDTPPTGHRTLPTASGALFTPPGRSPPRATDVLSPWESEQVRATWGREASAVPGSGSSPTARAVASRMSVIGDAWTGSADIFAPGPGVLGAGSPGRGTATSSQEDLALVVAGTASSPVASSPEISSARELAAVIMGFGRRVTPGHEMTRVPPTPSPTEDLPFGDRCGGVCPATTAVIKFTSVEYSVTKADIVSSIGESVALVNMPPNSGTYAIHIILDRHSAKSGDAYVEFPTASAALLVMNSRKNKYFGGRTSRQIGGRTAYLHLSTQEELMREIFPKAKCVTWTGQRPIISGPTDTYTSGFAGFITSEELVQTEKWATDPSKSKYTGTHPQRPYESMISLLFKFPWFSTNDFTLTLRDQIYTACVKMLVSLSHQVQVNTEPTCLTLSPQAYRNAESTRNTLTLPLLREFLHACLECPGFSDKQRASCIKATRLYDNKGILVANITPHIYISHLAPNWPFETLSKKDNSNEDKLWNYVELFGSVVIPQVTGLAMANAGLSRLDRLVSCLRYINVPWPARGEKSKMSFNDAVLWELGAVKWLLERALEMEGGLMRRDSPQAPAQRALEWKEV